MQYPPLCALTTRIIYCIIHDVVVILYRIFKTTMIMKKLFIITLFVLGMCNVSVFGMVQEIILTELYSIMPLDDPEDDTIGGRPDPSRFRASISGNYLSIGADTDMPAYVEVINEESGEVVVEEEFVEETEATIEQSGSYIIQIYSGNTVMTGEFEVE